MRNVLEMSKINAKGHYFKVDSKTFYHHSESIVYSFAQLTEKKNEFLIESCDSFEIINFVEHSGMAFLSYL